MKVPQFLSQLQSGLLGPQDSYNGLLDPEALSAARNQGLMQFGTSLLQASAPSATPTSFGAAFGNAAMQGRQAQSAYGDNSLQRKIMLAQLAQKGEGVKPIAIMGPDGNPIYVKPNEALGKTPYNMNSSGKPATDLQYYGQYMADEKAAGRAPKDFNSWSKDYYAGKQSIGYAIVDVNGVPTLQQTRAPSGVGIDKTPTPLTTQEAHAAGEAKVKSAVAGAEAGAKTTATSQAENKIALTSTLDNIQKMRDNVDNLISAKGFDTIYGASGKFDPRNYIPGTDAADANAKRDQLSAESFGITIQQMRGMGALSDAEGKKVTSAYTRATNPNISAKEARTAWNEVKGYLDKAEKVAKEKAGVSDHPADIQSLLDKYK